MENTEKLIEQMNSVTGIPLSLIDGTGSLIYAYPEEGNDTVESRAGITVVESFLHNGGSPLNPQIYFLEPGFLLGIIQLSSERYILIGLVSPYKHTRQEVLRTVSEVIHPAHLEQFCDRILQQPLVSLEKMKDLICLLSRLFNAQVSAESILFIDGVAGRKLGDTVLDGRLFEQHETEEYHVPQNFEQAICAAVEAGDRAMLERALFSPVAGKVGRMSVNDLRQQKYEFVCLATLISRAAIRGGLESETAFSLSDLYCQRADMLTDISLIQNLTFTMLMDFCGKVRENSKRPAATPVIENCLQYISVHLHDPITLDLLSRHCGLCGRSLSIRFREEMGMGITEYIHREKLREAQYLLRHTDYSLTAITSYLNYPSQSYFTQIFKKYKGQTPQQYRENRKQENRA